MTTIRALIDRWHEAHNTWSLEGLPELLTPDCEIRSPLGHSLTGPDGAWAIMGQVRASFPDFRAEVLEVLGEGPAAVARVRYRGTHEGFFAGSEATGRSFTLEALVRFTARDDRLSSVLAFPEQGSLRSQLGLREAPPPSPTQVRLVPTLRSNDWDKSRAFYALLGFEVQFEWRHAPDFPVYAGLVGHGVAVHISEHSGDCEVGGSISIQVEDVDALHAELVARGAEVSSPTTHPWKVRDFGAVDPDGNKIGFCTPLAC